MNHNIVELGPEFYIKLAEISLTTNRRHAIEHYSENNGFKIKYHFRPFANCVMAIPSLTYIIGGCIGAVAFELVGSKESYELDYVYVKVSENRASKLILNYGRCRYISPVPYSNSISLILPLNKCLDKKFFMDYCAILINSRSMKFKTSTCLIKNTSNTESFLDLADNEKYEEHIKLPLEILEKESDVLFGIMLKKKEVGQDMVYEFEGLNCDVFKVLRKYMNLKELDMDIRRLSSNMGFVYELHRIVTEFNIKGLHHVSASLVSGYETIN